MKKTIIPDPRWTEDMRQRAAQYREDALADGWASEPLSKWESEESWSSLRRDGFVLQIVARAPHPKTEHLMEQKNPEGGVWAWGPDGMAISIGSRYSWDELHAGLTTCNECRAHGPTFRYSFAGRCCAGCLPAMRKKHEYPGWTN